MYSHDKRRINIRGVLEARTLTSRVLSLPLTSVRIFLQLSTPVLKFVSMTSLLTIRFLKHCPSVQFSTLPMKYALEVDIDRSRMAMYNSGYNTPSVQWSRRPTGSSSRESLETIEHDGYSTNLQT